MIYRTYVQNAVFEPTKYSVELIQIDIIISRDTVCKVCVLSTIFNDIFQIR